MIDENEELAEAFKNKFPDWKKKKEFIKDLIDGTKVISNCIYNLVKLLLCV